MGRFAEFGRQSQFIPNSIDGRLLDRRITIQQLAVAQDASGQRSDAWRSFAENIAARIRPLSGGERLAAEAVQSAEDSEITIRYRPGVVQSMRVLYGARVFTVTSVVNIDERNEWLRLRCAEGLAQS